MRSVHEVGTERYEAGVRSAGNSGSVRRDDPWPPVARSAGNRGLLCYGLYSTFAIYPRAGNEQQFRVRQCYKIIMAIL